MKGTEIDKENHCGRIGNFNIWETTGSGSGTGQIYSHDERIRQLVERLSWLIRLAWMYGIGSIIERTLRYLRQRLFWQLGAVNTKKIRLTSAVSILSVWIRFDCSNNMPPSMPCQMDERRLWLEEVPSRNPFPLFGYDLKDYEALLMREIRLASN